MEALDIAGVLRQLPHRYPFLLIDRIVSIEPGKRIVALKNVTVNEPYFQGHFPGTPVMPGVLIIESMAQAAGILAFRALGGNRDEKKLIYFAGIDNARFKRPVVPGDQLIIEATMGRVVRSVGKFEARARVGDALAAEAEFMAALR